MSDKRIGELSFGWFAFSTLTLLALALIVFVPLSKNMKTVDQPSESQKTIKELEERVREIDVLKGRIDALQSHPAAPPAKNTQGNGDGDDASARKNPRNVKRNN